MLKKIRVEQLTLGMHIKAFCGSWLEHPFWRSRFTLTSEKDLETIRASRITELWIDCARGIDVAPGVQAVTESVSEAQIDQVLKQAFAAQRDTRPTTLEAELRRAGKIRDLARSAVQAMFQEARMGKALDMSSVQPLVEEISDSVNRHPGALVSLVRLKTADDYTYMHSVAVCTLMVALARQLGLDEADTRSAGIAGLLHDIGKAALPMSVLKKPGRLTEEEFDIVRQHPAHGQRMLSGQVTDPVVLDVVLHHHEKTDGTGYPERLAGDAISLFAKMGAICDVYDAITSNRPYKPGWDPAEAISRMAEWTQGHLDGPTFQAFVKSIGIYPIGSLVKLRSGRVGVVIGQSAQSLLTPRVKVFYSTRSRSRIKLETVDLSQPESAEAILNRENPVKWGFLNPEQLIAMADAG